MVELEPQSLPLTEFSGWSRNAASGCNQITEMSIKRLSFAHPASNQYETTKYLKVHPDFLHQSSEIQARATVGDNYKSWRASLSESSNHMAADTHARSTTSQTDEGQRFLISPWLVHQISGRRIEQTWKLKASILILSKQPIVVCSEWPQTDRWPMRATVAVIV